MLFTDSFLIQSSTLNVAKRYVFPSDIVSKESIEDTFNTICSDIINIYNRKYYPFITDIMNSQREYNVTKIPLLTIEERMTLQSIGLKPKDITKAITDSRSIRLFSYKPSNNINIATSYIIHSLMYNAIDESTYSGLTVFIDENAFKDSTLNSKIDKLLFTVIFPILVELLNKELCEKLGIKLSSAVSVNVDQNNAISYNVNDSILVLPNLSVESNTYFAYLYYRSLMQIVLSIFNTNTIKSFTDLKEFVILPGIFSPIPEINDDIYTRIFNLVLHNMESGLADDIDKVVDLCLNIMDLAANNFVINSGLVRPDNTEEASESEIMEEMQNNLVNGIPADILEQAMKLAQENPVSKEEVLIDPSTVVENPIKEGE